MPIYAAEPEFPFLLQFQRIFQRSGSRGKPVVPDFVAELSVRNPDDDVLRSHLQSSPSRIGPNVGNFSLKEAKKLQIGLTGKVKSLSPSYRFVIA